VQSKLIRQTVLTVRQNSKVADATVWRFGCLYQHY